MMERDRHRLEPGCTPWHKEPAMRRLRDGCLALLLWVGSVTAAEPQGRLVQEIWEAAYLEGGKAGYVHTRTRELDQDGRKLLRTTTELNLTVKRFNNTLTLRAETGTDETPEGKVTGVSMRQFLGQKQDLVLTGTVLGGNKLRVKVEGSKRLEDTIPWDDQVVGLYRQERLFREHKVKPGDQFRYQIFEPQLSAVLGIRVVAKDYEVVEVFKTKTSLLRVEAVADKIQNVQLPPSIYWLDKTTLAPVRSELDIPGLGKLVLYRGTERQVKTGDSTARVDIGFSQLIRLNRTIRNPYQTQAAVYRLKLQGDEDPLAAVAQDARQEIKILKGNTFELHIRAHRGPQPNAQPDKVAPKEFLHSSFFITSDDDRVKDHARRAVGTSTDPWEKALRIEKWVHENMDLKNFSEAFATASEAARSREGDCTEHAVLAAAMCRAVGVPSRTALGLLYVDSPRGPAMGYHMWTEVWVKGQWLPIDATLGRGYVGATHLKIADHSWHETQSLTPLLPILRVIGKLSIEVVRGEGAD
jgi:transglutaminase-like putative cysteine protease